MPIGGKSRDLELRAPAAEAVSRAEGALSQVGKVKDVDQSKGLIKGSIRYGLQKVLVKAQIQESGNGSTVSLKAQGDDVWGMGAKKVLERWANAIEGGS